MTAGCLLAWAEGQNVNLPPLHPSEHVGCHPGKHQMGAWGREVVYGVDLIQISQTDSRRT